MEFYMKLPRTKKEFALFMGIVSIISVNIIAPLITCFEAGFHLYVWLDVLKGLPLLWAGVLVVVLLTYIPAEKLTAAIVSKDDSFLASVTIILNILVFAGLDLIIWFLRTPEELVQMMRDYLSVIFAGLVGIFLYNFFASLLRSLGNSVVPLAFLAVSACLNIVLDLWFVTGLHRGVAGAAEATVIAQYVSGIGIAIYTFVKFPQLLRREQGVCLRKSRVKEITSFSALTCMQQSIMNLGILAVQGLVNSFGTTIMAAFAAAVKIDAFAYLPVQDFGNAFSIFTAQNYGAKKPERIKKGIRTAVLVSVSFSLLISLCVCLFAAPLMSLFIDASEAAVIAEGARYLRIEGAFYCGIGCLFLLFGNRLLPSGHRPAFAGVEPRCTVGGTFKAALEKWGYRL